MYLWVRHLGSSDTSHLSYLASLSGYAAQAPERDQVGTYIVGYATQAPINDVLEFSFSLLCNSHTGYAAQAPVCERLSTKCIVV